MSSENQEFSAVTKQAKLLLQHSGIGEKLPTPVDEIVAAAELVVSQDITLSEPHLGFFTKSKKLLLSALHKAKGLIDLRENVIYLDTTALPQRQAFVKLHEVGHKFLPWQRDSFLFLDDDITLDPDVKELFEQEANYFASEVLFQIDRFDREARDLPLTVKSPMHLAKRYGASIHSSLRRFVRSNHRACGLFVVEYPKDTDSTGVLPIRSTELSPKFKKHYGLVEWAHVPVHSTPYRLLVARRRLVEDVGMVLTLPNAKAIPCRFDVFYNGWNSFLFFYPEDERATTRTKIVVSR